MNFDLLATAKERIIVCAHRGAPAGNVPCNTLPAYECALALGADMIEIDVDMTRDGELVIFHPGMERSHLGYDGSIRDLTFREVKELRYLNYDRVTTQFGLNTLDEVFETFRGRCFINVDKFYDHPKEISEAIKRHGIAEQILVKSAMGDHVISVLRELAPEIAFMPVVSRTHPYHDMLMREKINYAGAEVLFFDDGDEVASRDFVDAMHRDGKILWVNPIIYDVNAQITAGHSDDRAASGDMDGSWGWLADRGYDVLQTDRPGMLIDYLKKSGKYYR